ncbi:hypothetical protein [Photorhabdus bodei]|uniref:Uncharacterized protein n=1 Tax=Photorhabdus bodei TaxID=2029681 RepID=A0A329X2Z1_9GAMM|nr:hypothetical protein [Photorhabdus bodei]NDL01517.1 hypothetical protein [Photorhabdus bodei]NDL05768.1 hypothetical protein [Photorhabdus bodei]NDL10021.1 hypothetical protein [Photorhabdus bodei]RAX09723.1 hypothetical protein CKY02_16695 [Photorhabdus bodei]
MTWEIPEPHVVHRPASLNWSLWWRLFSLICFVVVVAASGFWYMFEDPRSVFYAVVAVVGAAMVFGLIAGWQFFRYGVELEQAELLTQENAWQEAYWQAWASQGMKVVDYHAIFPPEVPSPADSAVLVNGDSALVLPPFPGYTRLFEEVLGPMRQSLLKHVTRRQLTLYFPLPVAETVWHQFCQVWQKLGFSLSQLQGPVVLKPDYASQLNDWLVTESQDLMLIITWSWESPDERSRASDGAVAWLLTASSSKLPAKCCLHRTMTTTPDDAQRDIARFLHYQCPAVAAGTLWDNDVDPAIKDRLLIQLNQVLTSLLSPEVTTAPVMPDHQCVSHWLGKSGDFTDWFTLTLAMRMAEYQHVPQLFLLSQHATLQLGTVSPVNPAITSGNSYV